MPRWTYVFTDLATGVELATLPMYGVSFEQKLLDIGVLEGIVPTTDPAIRALDPWSATRARKTAVFVECDGLPVWGGIVWGSVVSQTDNGIKITAATFESWLNYAFLTADVTNLVGANLGAPSTINVLVSTVQRLTGANIGLVVGSSQYPWNMGQGGDGTGEWRVAGQVYAAADVKPLQDVLVHWVTVWGNPIEWRVDVARSNGLDQYGKPTQRAYTITLNVVDSQSLDDGRPVVLLRYAPTLAASNLLTFTDADDGTQQPTGVVTSANGTNAAGANVTFFAASTADAVGVPELASGYPLLQAAETYPAANTTSTAPLTQAAVTNFAQAEMLDRLAQGSTISNLTVRPDAPALGSYYVGDPCRLEIAHPGYPEWPAPHIYDPWRIVGRKVTVGVGSTPDTVSLTVVPNGDRIPNSRTVTAEIRRMASRIRMMEVKAGL